MFSRLVSIFDFDDKDQDCCNIRFDYIFCPADEMQQALLQKFFEMQSAFGTKSSENPNAYGNACVLPTQQNDYQCSKSIIPKNPPLLPTAPDDFQHSLTSPHLYGVAASSAALHGLHRPTCGPTCGPIYGPTCGATSAHEGALACESNRTPLGRAGSLDAGREIDDYYSQYAAGNPPMAHTRILRHQGSLNSGLDASSAISISGIFTFTSLSF